MVAKRISDKTIATSPAGKKRKQTVDPHAKLLSTVADGIKSADIPSMISEMLVETSQLSLGIFKEERHSFQQEVVEMVGKVLRTKEASVEQIAENLSAKIEAEEQEKSMTAEKLREAEASVEAKKEDVKIVKYTLAEHATTYKAAKDAVIAAQLQLAEAEKSLKEAAAKKTLLETAVSEEGKALTEGSLAEDQITATLDKLMTTLRKFDFDTSMMTALPTALQKVPSTRGEFDVLVVAQFDEEVKKRVSAFEKTLQSGEATTAELTAAVQAAKDDFAKAQEALKSKAKLFKEAQAAKEACDTSVSEAKKELKARTTELKKCTRDSDAARAEVELFRAGPLAAFEELRELTAVANDATLDTLAINDATVQGTPQEIAA